MSSPRQTTFAVLVSSIIDSYQRGILQGVRAACDRKNIHLLIISDEEPGHPDYPFQDEYSLFHHIDGESIDGLILLSGALAVYLGTQGLADYLAPLKAIPMVSLGLVLPEIPSILVDNERAVIEMVDHLVKDHGYKNVAILKGPEANREALDRYQGYCKALDNHGLELQEELIIQGEFEPGDGHMAMELLLEERGLRFDALVCEDDLSALEALQYLKDNPMDNPPAVVGFDDIEVSAFSEPPLTTVRQPLYEMGEVSVYTLLDMLIQKEVPLQHFLKAQVSLRESCHCQPLELGGNFCEDSAPLSPDAYSARIDLMSGELENRINEQGEKGSLVEKEIQALLQRVKTFLYDQDEKPLKKEILALARRSMDRNRDASFWTGILLPYFNTLGLDTRISPIWTLVRAFLHQGENLYRGKEKLRYDQLITHFHSMIDLLVMGANREDLLKTLIKGLPLLRINSLLIFLYEERAEMVRLFFAYRDGEAIPVEEGQWESHRFYPKDSMEWQNRTYFIMPLHADEKSLGYVLFEESDISNEFFQDLSEKLSRSLQGIFLMERLQGYTTQLEEEVARRTKQLEEANLQLQDLSFRDELSGLHNRRFLNEVILPEATRLKQKLFYKSQKPEKRCTKDWSAFALFMIDLDHFKWVNDSYGHDAGDQVIQQVSHIFNEQCRTDDFVVRFGGEEFLIVMRDFQASVLAEKAEKIRQAVYNHTFELSNGVTFKRSCSIGCMHFPLLINQKEDLGFYHAIQLVDKALYYAKEHGRNQSILMQISPEITKIENWKDRLLEDDQPLQDQGLISYLRADQ